MTITIFFARDGVEQPTGARSCHQCPLCSDTMECLLNPHLDLAGGEPIPSECDLVRASFTIRAEVRDRNGLKFQDTPYGRAYGETLVPTYPPLTEAELRALPDKSRILVLWMGGNGPHEYTLSKGAEYLYALTSRGNQGSRLEFVGSHKTCTKVWAVRQETT